VHVSDQIPCNLAGSIYFSRSSDPNACAVMVLEKAYAKLHGTYESLRAGRVEYALEDLSGLACSAVRLTDPRHAPRVESGAAWQQFKAEFAAGHRHCFSRTRGPDPRAGERGLLGGHAYPVLEVCELHADSTADLEALDVKLVRMADRWGIGDGWRGDWCRGSGCWEDYPDIARIVERKGAIPGSFWIKWEDMVANFTTVFTVYAGAGLDAPATKSEYKGAWSTGDVKSGAGGLPPAESFPQNPQ
jgi:hypothetical protein